MLSQASFILSKKKVLEQFTIMQELADQVSYSFKTNLEVGKILEENTNCFFSCHFINTMKEIQNKNRVWFFTQGLSREELNLLYEYKPFGFVVDNEEDLKVLLEFIQEKNWKINLLLRMRLKENTIHTGKHYVYGMFSKQINKFIPELRENKLIEKLGVHFHRKTQNVSEWNLKSELNDSLSEKVWQNIDFVNIGGGFPAVYKNYRPIIINSIFEKVKELREWLKEKGIQIIVEPGRFIAAPACKLETKIVRIYNNNIIVNASVYNSFMDTFVANIRLLIEGELEKGKAFTIKGNTPCSTDVFRYRVFLKEPKVGDKLVFLNAGAYNYSTDFCNLKKLETKIED